MNYNKKFKTPLLQPMRTNCGTLYTFSSALEDVGLNINERNNIVKLSKYAILNLPPTKPTNGSDDTHLENNFNFQNILGAYAYFNGRINENKPNPTIDASEAIPLSLQSYALNLEASILSSDDYDPTLPLTVSERVFWKWLKESGAIRWEVLNGVLMEETDSTHYNSIVKAIGNITAGAFKTNSFGNFNEVLVQLPTSFGKTPVRFKQVSDNNYYFGQQINCPNDYVLGQEEGDIKNSLPNIAFYDYINSQDSVTILSKIPLKYDDGSGLTSGWWYSQQGITPSKEYSYIIDKDNVGDSNGRNIYLQIGDSKMVRSNIDCMSIDFDIESYTGDLTSLDELASQGVSGYDFNAILLYYSVYNSTGTAILSTNLLGILFLDSGIGSISYSNYNSTIEGEIMIPYLTKYKSNTLFGDFKSDFGNSFNFRVNIQSNNLQDNKASYIEDSTSLNYLDDFTKVYGNLNQAISILGKHTKTINSISSKYIDTSNIVNSLIIKNDKLTKALNGVIDRLHLDLSDTTSPTIKLGKNIALKAVNSSNSTVVGYNACYNTLNIENSVVIGAYAGYNNEDCLNNIFIGCKAGFFERNNNRLHIECNENFLETPLIYGNFSSDNREVCINASSFKLPKISDIGSGIALVWDNGSVKLASSSIRYKENVKKIYNSNVSKLQPCSFNYTNDISKTVCYGLMAEDVEKIDKNLVIYDENGNPNGVKYDMLSVLLINEIKKLQGQIDDLKEMK